MLFKQKKESNSENKNICNKNNLLSLHEETTQETKELQSKITEENLHDNLLK